MVRTWCWVLGLVAVGCASFPKLELTSLPTSKDYPHADYVVLLDEAQLRFETGPSGAPQALLTERWRIRVFKPTTLPALSAHYSRTFSRIEQMHGRVIHPDGKEQLLDLSKRTDRSVFSGSVLFTDDRAVELPIPPLPVGSIFESEVVTRRFDVTPWVYATGFGSTRPTRVARLEVVAPRDWRLRWSTQAWQGADFAPVEKDVGELRSWTVELKDLDALELEPQGPAAFMHVPSVSLRLEEWTQQGSTRKAFATPESLSSWLAAAYARQAAVTPELEATVQSVLKDVPAEPEAKARALYEHACRAIQYCAIEIGYGGWIPHAAQAVQKTRYGDCKDKATYLHTLLRIAGISSAPTLIYSHSGTPRPFQLPSLGANFNHAILAIDLPGGTVYADPTSRAVPFGQLPPSDQEAPVLELREGGTALKVTPSSPPVQNVHRQLVRLALDPRGNGTGTLRFESRGANAIDVKQRLLAGTGRLTDWVRSRMWNRSGHVSKARPLRFRDFLDDVVVEGTLEARLLFSRSTRGEAMIRLSELFDTWMQVWPEQRKSDVVSPFAQTLESTLVLELPVGTQVRTLPADVELDSADATYRLTWRASGSTLEATRTLVRKNRVLPVARLAEANAFAARVLAAEHASAVVQLPSLEAAR